MSKYYQKPIFLFYGSLVVLTCCSGLATEVNAAKSDQLKAQIIVQAKSQNESYEACRKSILPVAKTDVTQARILSQKCRERYPAASLYVDCKKKVLQNFKDKKFPIDSLKLEMSRCFRYFSLSSFNPEDRIPFEVVDKKLFFAGISLNTSIRSEASLPNFDCQNVVEASQGRRPYDYFLFGNHPKMFRGFADLSDNLLSTKIKSLSRSSQGKLTANTADVLGLGRVIFAQKAKDVTLMLPFSQCNFVGQKGANFEGLQVAYLVDQVKGLWYPYFAVAYYTKTGPRIPEFQGTVQAALKKLGESFKEFKKNTDTRFLVTKEPEEFDEEGDPRNLCKDPRSHQYLGIIKAAKQLIPKSAIKSELLLVANIENYCKFGDLLASRVR